MQTSCRLSALTSLKIQEGRWIGPIELPVQAELLVKLELFGVETNIAVLLDICFLLPCLTQLILDECTKWPGLEEEEMVDPASNLRYSAPCLFLLAKELKLLITAHLFNAIAVHFPNI